MNALQTKAVEAATRFCKRRGCEILATNWESPTGARADIVADDAGTICFIDVTATERTEDRFSDGHTEREAWEILAASWLGDNPPAHDASVRFDRCDLLFAGSNHALLRYHSDALGRV